MDTNCFLKAVMVTVGGGAMGFVMALFMNAVEYREIEYGRSKMPTRAVLRVWYTYKYFINKYICVLILKERFLSNVIDEQRLCIFWMFF